MELEEMAFFLDTEIYIIDQATENQNSDGQLRLYGENKAFVACFVKCDGVFSKSEDFEFIQKILLAVKLTLLEVAIVNLVENPTINWHQIHQTLSPKKAIFFGVEPSEFAIEAQIDIHHPQYYQDTKLLLTAPLASISSDKALKVEFWTALKELFK